MGDDGEYDSIRSGLESDRRPSGREIAISQTSIQSISRTNNQLVFLCSALRLQRVSHQDALLIIIASRCTRSCHLCSSQPALVVFGSSSGPRPPPVMSVHPRGSQAIRLGKSQEEVVDES